MYGDAGTLQAVTSGIAKSFGIASFFRGLEEHVPDETKALVAGGLQKIVEGVASALNGLGKPPDRMDIEEALKRVPSESYATSGIPGAGAGPSSDTGDRSKT